MEEYPNLEPHKAPQSPKKEYKDTSSITYYPSQLVARFFDKHKTIAHLQADGTITWETQPNLLVDMITPYIPS
jgi:hypothetical protein